MREEVENEKARVEAEKERAQAVPRKQRVHGRNKENKREEMAKQQKMIK